MLKVRERQVGRIRILELRGRLTLGTGKQAFREKLRSLVAGGQKEILLDCSGVVTLDSQGLTALMESYLSLREQGGELKLVNLPPLLREVLELTGLLTVIPCFRDEEAGLRSFSSP